MTLTRSPRHRMPVRRLLAASSTSLVAAALLAPGAAHAIVNPATPDLTPPVTSLDQEIPAWSDGDLFVTMTATDPTVAGETTSGVASIVYQIKNGSTISDPHTVDSGYQVVLVDGDQLIYHAVDVAENIESDNESPVVHVDNVSPMVAIDPGTAAPWYKAAPQVTITGTDDKSGFANGSVQYRFRTGTGDRGTQRAVVVTAWVAVPGVSSTTVTVPDGATLETRVFDSAGNASDYARFGPVNVDADAPVTTASAIPSSGSAPVPVTLTATDAKSGVASTQFQIVGTDGKLIGSPATYSAASLPVLTSGQSLRFWSTDAVGNVEAAQTTAPANGPAVVAAAVATPHADLALNAKGKRVLFSGTSIPVQLTAGGPAARLKTTVAFVAQGKTIVALPARITSVLAGKTATEPFATTRKQRKAIRRMMGAEGTGGEIQLTTVAVDASGKEIGKPVLTRRGLRKTSAA